MNKMRDSYATLFVVLLAVFSTAPTNGRSYHPNADTYKDWRAPDKREQSELPIESNDVENRYNHNHHRPAGYKYEYSVGDPHTGDYKSQHEERVGDAVRGSYSLVEPDGRRRIVEYTADAKHGFTANVRHVPVSMAVHHHLQHNPRILRAGSDDFAPHSQPPPIAHSPAAATSVTHVPHSSATAPTTPVPLPGPTPSFEPAAGPRKTVFDLPQHWLHQMLHFRTHLPSSTPTPATKYYYANLLARMHSWPFAF